MNSLSLYCVAVSDPDGVVCLESPIIFHVRAISGARATERVKIELNSEDYGYDMKDIEGLDFLAFVVSEAEILEES